MSEPGAPGERANEPLSGGASTDWGPLAVYTAAGRAVAAAEPGSDTAFGTPGQIGAEGGTDAGGQWSPVTYRGPRRHRSGPGGDGTGPAAASGPTAHTVAPADLVDTGAETPRGTPERGLLSSSRTMAIASLASRVTGFLRSVALAAALGVAASRVADSYNLANILPNMVYELLLGGVLSSVVIPLIVNAQEHDDDHGAAYTQRLLSWATVTLGAATLLAVAAAPLLAAAFARAGDQRDLISIFATLLLPEIFFYGLGAMFTAVLNTKGVYGPPAWAPVLNNVVTILTVGVFALLPGPSVLSAASITTPQILVLGVGTTLGIAVQAVVLVPYLRRTGFRWRWRFRVTSAETLHMREIRTLAAWVLGYVAISQVGVFVVNRVANRYQGGPTTFAYADLLFQVPYGIIGVSLLTALMPRMSRSAARADHGAVVADLSLGARLSAVGLIPITAGLMVMGPALTTVLFFYGRTDLADARHIGVVLALGSFGLLPFAVVMLQLRVFYALRDARTPTLVNLFMIITKVTLVLLGGQLLSGRHVIEALAVSTSTSYLVGAIVGHLLLTRRFGRLGFTAVARTVARVAACSAAGAAVAFGAVELSRSLVGAGRGGAALAVLGGSVLGGGVAVLAMRVARVPEVEQILASVRPG